MLEVPTATGVKRTVTSWLPHAASEYAPPEMTENGPLVVALPERTPPPRFCTVKFRSSELPSATVPKFRENGVTLIRVGGNVLQRSERPSLRLCVLKLNWPALWVLVCRPTVAEPPRSDQAHAPPITVSA